MLSSYRDLVVWQKSVDLVEEIYRLTRLFPKLEVMKMLNGLINTLVAKP